MFTWTLGGGCTPSPIRPPLGHSAFDSVLPRAAHPPERVGSGWRVPGTPDPGHLTGALALASLRPFAQVGLSPDGLSGSAVLPCGQSAPYFTAVFSHDPRPSPHEPAGGTCRRARSRRGRRGCRRRCPARPAWLRAPSGRPAWPGTCPQTGRPPQASIDKRGWVTTSLVTSRARQTLWPLNSSCFFFLSPRPPVSPKGSPGSGRPRSLQEGTLRVTPSLPAQLRLSFRIKRQGHGAGSGHRQTLHSAAMACGCYCFGFEGIGLFFLRRGGQQSLPLLGCKSRGRRRLALRCIVPRRVTCTERHGPRAAQLVTARDVCASLQPAASGGRP